jgi:uncharacterized SAM-binding protein YcdF (DUF218 family)
MQRLTKFRKFLKILLVIIAVYYGLIFFTPISRWLADKLVVPSIVSDADVIIILSGGTVKQQFLTYPTQSRLVHGIIIWRQGKAPCLLLSGGTSAQGGIPEAYLMADMARKLGVDSDKIYLEDQSINTRENIAYSAELMEKHGWKKALLVTSALHMKRALKLAEEKRLDCIPAAAPYSERYLSRYQLYRMVKHEYSAIAAQSILRGKNYSTFSKFYRWVQKLKGKIFNY